MRFLKSLRISLILFCSLFFLAAPAAADSPAAVEPEAVSSPDVQENNTPVPDQNVLKQQEARRSYERRSLYALHVNLPSLSLETDYLNDSWFVPQNGDGYTLTNEEFYEFLDNPELLDQYTSNSNKKAASSILIVGGAVGALGSIVWLYAASALNAFTSILGPTYPSTSGNGYLILPLSTLAVSAAAIITGIGLRPETIHPLKTNDAAKILDQYNNNLKQELGLSPDYSPTLATP